MSSYCLKYKRNTKSINPRLSKFALCGGKKSRLVKKQEPSGILSSLGFKNIIKSDSIIM